MVDFVTHDTRAAWAEAVARRTAGRLDDGLRTRGSAGLVVSGGGTPEPVYHHLATSALDWARVDVTLADERWVPPDHPDRNEATLRRSLLTHGAAAARFVSPGAGTGDAAAAALAWEAALPRRVWDVTLLGIGDDGHTASWFPGGDRLDAALDPGGARRCLALSAPGARHPRVTLTLPEILDTALILMLIVGEAKRQVYDRLSQVGPATAMPSRAVLRQTRVPVEVHWAP